MCVALCSRVEQIVLLDLRVYYSKLLRKVVTALTSES